MKRTKIALSGIALAAAGTLALAGCAGGGSTGTASSGAPAEGGDASAIITALGSEPQNGLVGFNTNEVGGGKIVDSIYAGLVYYDKDGKVVNDVADDIKVVDAEHLTVKIKDGQKFTDGSPVNADSFINAWNYGAKLSNAQLNASWFSDIEGFSDTADSDLTGLKKVDDLTFDITLNKPASDFAQRLGYSAFFPLPEVAFKDMKAFGNNPIGNGPYKLSGPDAWKHDEQITLVKNDDYTGGREVKNGGITFLFQDADAAYANLKANKIDVVDQLPATAMATFEKDLGDRAINQETPIFQSFTIPNWLPHFTGPEGELRRQAISLSVDRKTITEKIFYGTRVPAEGFVPTQFASDTKLAGTDVLTYDPKKAKELWAEADKISPWEGTFKIGYNADSSHKAWVDAVANSIKNALGIDAQGEGTPTFAQFRDLITGGTIQSAFRTGWQPDYPSQYNFLAPLYQTGASSNDGKYSSTEFDTDLTDGISAADAKTATADFDKAQEVLLKDLPAIPLWYANTTGGQSDSVSNVQIGWNSVPLYYEITKK